jgi:hypothetical protein
MTARITRKAKEGGKSLKSSGFATAAKENAETNPFRKLVRRQGEVDEPVEKEEVVAAEESKKVEEPIGNKPNAVEFTECELVMSEGVSLPTEVQKARAVAKKRLQQYGEKKKLGRPCEAPIAVGNDIIVPGHLYSHGHGIAMAPPTVILQAMKVTKETVVDTRIARYLGQRGIFVVPANFDCYLDDDNVTRKKAISIRKGRFSFLIAARDARRLGLKGRDVVHYCLIPEDTQAKTPTALFVYKVEEGEETVGEEVQAIQEARALASKMNAARRLQEGAAVEESKKVEEEGKKVEEPIGNKPNAVEFTECELVVNEGVSLPKPEQYKARAVAKKRLQKYGEKKKLGRPFEELIEELIAVGKDIIVPGHLYVQGHGITMAPPSIILQAMKVTKKTIVDTRIARYLGQRGIFVVPANFDRYLDDDNVTRKKAISIRKGRFSFFIAARDARRLGLKGKDVVHYCLIPEDTEAKTPAALFVYKVGETVSEEVQGAAKSKIP